MEVQHLTPIVAIDRGAAFDTVNHDLLLQTLQKCFGVCGSALAWIASYLSGRNFSVCVNGCKSSPISINFSVPQGSINGPIYFTCYSSTMGTCIGPGCELVGYADDHSLYTKYRAGNIAEEAASIARLSSALENTKQWMLENRLKMNDDKTEFTIFGSSHLLQKCDLMNITVGQSVVERSPVIKLLGVQLDEQLNFKEHISNKARMAALGMFNLIKLRPYLDRKTCLKLANALIFSHMDYANSLLVNLPKTTLHPFQRIQNLTAKIILGRSKYTSSTEALKELHILPVHVRCEFKLLVLVYKALNNLAPSYLKELLNIKPFSYKTRSSNSIMLEVPFTRHETFADRSFCVAGPKCWNRLPDKVKCCSDINMFKKELKTYLFARTFLS